MMRALALAMALVVVPLTLPAAEQKTITLPGDHEMATLKPGPGLEATRANCVACHSTDYIVLQPRGDAKQWQAVVTKMVKVFGAPVQPQDEKAIVEYLASTYGVAR